MQKRLTFFAVFLLSVCLAGAWSIQYSVTIHNYSLLPVGVPNAQVRLKHQGSSTYYWANLPAGGSSVAPGQTGTITVTGLSWPMDTDYGNGFLFTAGISDWIAGTGYQDNNQQIMFLSGDYYATTPTTNVTICLTNNNWNPKLLATCTFYKNGVMDGGSSVPNICPGEYATHTFTINLNPNGTWADAISGQMVSGNPTETNIIETASNPINSDHLLHYSYMSNNVELASGDLMAGYSYRVVHYTDYCRQGDPSIPHLVTAPVSAHKTNFTATVVNDTLDKTVQAYWKVNGKTVFTQNLAPGQTLSRDLTIGLDGAPQKADWGYTAVGLFNSPPSTANVDNGSTVVYDDPVGGTLTGITPPTTNYIAPTWGVKTFTSGGGTFAGANTIVTNPVFNWTQPGASNDLVYQTIVLTNNINWGGAGGGGGGGAGGINGTNGTNGQNGQNGTNGVSLSPDLSSLGQILKTGFGNLHNDNQEIELAVGTIDTHLTEAVTIFGVVTNQLGQLINVTVGMSNGVVTAINCLTNLNLSFPTNAFLADTNTPLLHELNANVKVITNQFGQVIGWMTNDFVQFLGNLTNALAFGLTNNSPVNLGPMTNLLSSGNNLLLTNNNLLGDINAKISVITNQFGQAIGYWSNDVVVLGGISNLLANAADITNADIASETTLVGISNLIARAYGETANSQTNYGESMSGVSNILSGISNLLATAFATNGFPNFDTNLDLSGFDTNGLFPSVETNFSDSLISTGMFSFSFSYDGPTNYADIKAASDKMAQQTGVLAIENSLLSFAGSFVDFSQGMYDEYPSVPMVINLHDICGVGGEMDLDPLHDPRFASIFDLAKSFFRWLLVLAFFGKVVEDGMKVVMVLNDARGINPSAIRLQVKKLSS